MIKLFQIGDTPIHLHEQRWHGWDIKGRGKSTEALWSPQFFFQNRQFQPDQQSIKIQSLVVDDGGRTARQQLERLRRLVDLPTSLIAYDTHSAGPLNSCLCGSFGRNDVMWYTTAGVLNQISEDSDNGTDIEVTLTITVNPHWTALNRYLWSWQDSDFDPMYPPPVLTPYSKFIQHYPSIYAESNHWSKRPVDKLVLYDPALWAVQHTNTGMNFQTGVGANFGATNHAVFIDENEWSAPPLSMYAFTNMPNTGGIFIHVKRLDGVFSAANDDLTAINLYRIDLNLTTAGLPGLQPTDILYVGDGYPKPGFLVRNNAIIAQVIATTYPRSWPGQLAPGKNGVTFDLPGSTQVAYLHTFRRM